MHPRESILEHRELVDFTEFLEQRLEIPLLQVARNLSYEQLDGVLVLHGHGGALLAVIQTVERNRIVVVAAAVDVVVDDDVVVLGRQAVAQRSHLCPDAARSRDVTRAAFILSPRDVIPASGSVRDVTNLSAAQSGHG